MGGPFCFTTQMNAKSMPLTPASVRTVLAELFAPSAFFPRWSKRGRFLAGQKTFLPANRWPAIPDPPKLAAKAFRGADIPVCH
jgi:hypothetical protein